MIWDLFLPLLIGIFISFRPAETNSNPKISDCWITPNNTNKDCSVYIFEENLPVDTKIGYYLVDDDDAVINFSFEQVAGQADVALLNQYFKFVKATGKSAYLVIKTKIDFEALDGTSSFTFNIIMSDPVNSVRKNTFIVVNDLNDNIPQFLPSDQCNIPENDATATCTSIEILDRDTDQSMTVTVKATGVSDGFFTATLQRITTFPKADGNKWKVTVGLTQALDYETQSFYQLTLEATDGAKRKGTGNLFVNVKDIADQPPQFRKLPYQTSKAENIPIGSQIYVVLAEDGDTGIKNPIKYQLKSGNPLNDIFQIDADTGNLTLAKNLDRESQLIRDALGIVELTVLAVEQTSPAQTPNLATSETTVRITVTDENDFPPTFKETSYNGTLDENTQKGLPITISPNIFVEDQDLGDNGKLTLSVSKNGQPYTVFSLTPSTIINSGEVLIRVADSSVLDFESVEELDFEVVAEEVNSPKRKVSVPVNVKLNNMNDNFPTFTQKLYQANLPENSALNTKVIQIQATDNDKGDFGVIQYNLSETNRFQINSSTGEVFVNVNADTDATLLDRETSSKYFLSVEARDNNGQPGGYLRFSQLQITLTDKNDNTPQFFKLFGKDYEASVQEGADPVNREIALQIQATDADAEPDNNKLAYSLETSTWSSYFSINSSTAQLKLIKVIDYEALPADLNGIIPITVKVTDAGTPPLDSTTPVKILVEDVNDNSPIFELSPYTASTLENATEGNFIIQVKATDKDKPGSLNANVFYRITSGGADKFKIDGASGNITVERSAQLSAVTINLTVTAFDRGVPQQSGETIVTITVQEVNDQNPFFNPFVLRYSVKENSNANPVVQYRATDFDKNAVLDYTIIQSEALDSDGKNVPSSTFDFQSYFTINNDGNISSTGALDREVAELITLTIKVVDTKAETPGQTATGTLSLSVEDENDNAPIFQKSADTNYTVSVPENTVLNGNPPRYATSLTLRAIDKDKGSVVTYAVDPADPIFILDSQSGQLLLQKALDRETKGFYSFTAAASDGKFTTNTTVYVTVLDTNDHNPEFKNFISPLEVSESTEIKTILTTVVATDLDEGEFGRVEYYVTGGNNKFSMNKTSGELKLEQPLDRDVPNGDSYTLSVEARDNNDGTYQGKSIKTMVITVTDINDNAPVFFKQNYTFNQIKENAQANEVVGEITASDSDSGDNAKIVFKLTGVAKITELFTIETNPLSGTYSGTIKTAKNLKGEFGCLEGQIVAEDQGSTKKTSSVPLQFCIADVNDFSPVFVNPDPTKEPFSIDLLENDEPKLLDTFEATDQDSGKNGEVVYSLISSTNDHLNFTIDPKNGQLQNTVKFDREKQTQFRFQVKAADSGQPVLFTLRSVVVNIVDIDDNPPEFPADQRIISFNFPENKAPNVDLPNNKRGSLIGSVAKAVDKDTGASGIVCYFIVSKDTDKFYLNEKTGELYSLLQLDRESQTTYEIMIKAVGPDQCNTTIFQWRPTTQRRRLLYLDEKPVVYNASDTSLANITIKVSDDNDNPPFFTKTFFFAGLTKESPPSSIVFEFQKFVTDKDAAGVESLTFSIPGAVTISSDLKAKLESASITASNVFELNANTGRLVTGSKVYFDSAMQGYFDFKIKVNDGKYEAESNCKVYLLSPNQRLIAVAWDPIATVGLYKDKFASYLSNITGLEVTVDNIVTHKKDNGEADPTKTNMHMHAVNRTTNEVVSADVFLNLLDKNAAALQTLYKEYNIIKVVKEVDDTTNNNNTFNATINIVLIVVACVLCIIVLVVCISMWTCRRMYRTKLKAATAVSYGGAGPNHNGLKEGMPGTNLHTYEGSNPIWLEGTQNSAYIPDHISDYDSVSGMGDFTGNGTITFKDGRRLGAPVYDEQEISMNLYPDMDKDSNSSNTLPARNSVLLNAALDEHGRQSQILNSSNSDMPTAPPHDTPPPAYANGVSQKSGTFYPSTAI